MISVLFSSKIYWFYGQLPKKYLLLTALTATNGTNPILTAFFKYVLTDECLNEVQFEKWHKI